MIEDNSGNDEAMEKGIGQILGTIPQDPPLVLGGACYHITDGFEEDRNNTNITFRCLSCGELYKVPIKDLE